MDRGEVQVRLHGRNVGSLADHRLGQPQEVLEPVAGRGRPHLVGRPQELAVHLRQPAHALRAHVRHQAVGTGVSDPGQAQHATIDHDVRHAVGRGIDHQALQAPETLAVRRQHVLADPELPHSSVPLSSLGSVRASGRTSIRFLASSRRSWQTRR